MGEHPNKRKGGPGGDRGNLKKSKGGSNKWKTPNQLARQAAQLEQGTKLGVGDSGIWVTYARGQRPRAVREFIDLCEVYAQEMYGIKPFHADKDESKEDDDEEEGAEDIEASIQRELNTIQEKKSQPQDRTFTSINTGIECVFFLKARASVNAVELTLRMCHDARKGTEPKGSVRCRYINRLVPVVDVERSTEGGIEKVGREVLGKDFALRGENKEGEEEQEEGREFCTYAIRQNIRHNKELRSEDLIKKVAGLVDERHKVNLSKPDKVILVEVFQLYCGMSVVDGKEWEELKRYNVNELYRLAREDAKKNGQGEVAEKEAEEKA